MSDHLAGTEVYYLEDIRDGINEIANGMNQLVQMEKTLYTQSIQTLAEKKTREMQQEYIEPSRTFGETIALAERPLLAQSVIARLDENILARLARAFSALQDEIHELAMRKLKETEVAKGTETYDSVEDVNAPFVAIVPK